MALTATQVKAFETFKTPAPNSPLWFEDPVGEDKDDKKTPLRMREMIDDYYVLVEQVVYRTFPPPEVRAKLKAAGKPVKPLAQERYYIHLLHSTRLTARTLKVYKHQGRMHYADGFDLSISTSAKGGPAKDRDTLLGVLARCLKVDEYRASTLLSLWTRAN